MDIDIVRLIAGIITFICFIISKKKTSKNRTELKISKTTASILIFIAIIIPIIYFINKDVLNYTLDIIAYIWLFASLIWLFNLAKNSFSRTS